MCFACNHIFASIANRKLVMPLLFPSVDECGHGRVETAVWPSPRTAPMAKLGLELANRMHWGTEARRKAVQLPLFVLVDGVGELLIRAPQFWKVNFGGRRGLCGEVGWQSSFSRPNWAVSFPEYFLGLGTLLKRSAPELMLEYASQLILARFRPFLLIFERWSELFIWRLGECKHMSAH